VREADMRSLLEAACRAPSSHNTQPWRFAVRGSAVDVMADRSRQLGVVDPDGRELVVSCGAAAGTLVIAARAPAVDPQLALLPDGEAGDILARVTLSDGRQAGGELEAMAAAIEARRTVRRPLTGKAPPPDLMERLSALAAACEVWLAPVPDMARGEVADLVAEGDGRQWADAEFRPELAGWLRRPGAPEGVPTPAVGVTRLAVRMMDMGKRMAAADRSLAVKAPMLAVLGVDTDTPRGWILGGVALSHVLLRATASGVSAGFLNQPVQVADLRPRLAEAAGRPDGYPLVMLRLGDSPRSPGRRSGRRPLEDVMNEAPDGGSGASS
jgi:nitroreductase